MIRALVEEHGGIAVVVTHPVYPATRKQVVERWQNTIICRDGWTHALTSADEAEMGDENFPERLRAHQHLSVGEDGVRVLTEQGT